MFLDCGKKYVSGFSGRSSQESEEKTVKCTFETDLSAPAQAAKPG